MADMKGRMTERYQDINPARQSVMPNGSRVFQKSHVTVLYIYVSICNLALSGVEMRRKI